MSWPNLTFSWESARKLLKCSPSESISTFTFKVVSLEYQFSVQNITVRTSKIGTRSDSSRLFNHLTQIFDTAKRKCADATSNNPAFLSKNEEIADWPRSVRLRRDTSPRASSGSSADVSFSTVTLADNASSVCPRLGVGEDNGGGVSRVLV
jgi:hypothetical protein